MLVDALLCLALNIYHESRGEPLDGQRAVAQVTMNRAGQDPAKVCDVVFEPYQFAWTNALHEATPRTKPEIVQRYMPTELAAWERAKRIATKALYGRMQNVVGRATHFYDPTRANPAWAHKMVYVSTVGAHRFYVN